MKKFLYGALLTFFPLIASAANSLSFTPPAGDVSVSFLSNIFGTVDGVLQAGGSQIMGTMFGVFNAAVLGLGGIIIIYTLLVATINTAHEGQMLGQKWSLIWVPVRSTLGLALLIPKASGYCLMQIFVMWVVVQGVGAADKVWEAALSYLNRGGVIVQQRIDPIASLRGGESAIAKGAGTILLGQVCMLGIERVLNITRDGYLKQKEKKLGLCYNPRTRDMEKFCKTSIPDFLSTVNTITYQSKNASQDPLVLPMPNFDSDSDFSVLNGICGTLSWRTIDAGSIKSVNSVGTISKAELETIKMSRAIAIQQMYSNLSTVTQIIINNDPELTSTPNTNSSTSKAAPWAQLPFGIPYLKSGQPCSTLVFDCTSWDAGNSQAPLFSGIEFQGAVADYNGVMLPTMSLLRQSADRDTANQQRKFIKEANTVGWMLAGSYFFNLATINTANTSTAGASTSGPVVDQGSGLDQSTFSTDKFTTNLCSGGQYHLLCIWMNGDIGLLTKLGTLIKGNTLGDQPEIPISMSSKVVTNTDASTVVGFIKNSQFIQLPGQLGGAAPRFIFRVVPGFTQGNQPEFPSANFPCGGVKILFFTFCLISWIGQLLYEFFIRFLLSWLLQMVSTVINMVLMAFLALPLQGMSEIFRTGISYLRQPNVNPIVALAYMGTNYINFAMQLWIYLIILAIQAALFPMFGIFIFPLIALTAPLLFAWLGIMMGIGFTTAYFIPFVPYMIFTFGAIAWLMAVVEAMVAAPIVALGITHPEGEGPFGKGEQAVLILMNVFLRPALMIIGYIAGIILSYVSIWVINAGFANVLVFIQGTNIGEGLQFWPQLNASPTHQPTESFNGYGDWAGIYGFFFSILMYTTIYLTVVQKAFTLITALPDKVLRWIGGQQESVGQEATQWSEESKKQVESSGQATHKAAGQMSKQIGSGATKKLGELAGGGGKAELGGGGG